MHGIHFARISAVADGRRDAMLALYMLSSCARPSVRPSVTRRYCTKTANRKITQNANNVQGL